ncbi:metallophosphoesterase family protein [Nocardiopsis deserti]|uniref:metallophosphoesterase family protein n=1 Tax=Nocardiopsis deserti TaxID=2605988 RepID=UPI001239619E|nr:metallophosphoesterase [Nocardiopsis deserti]
MRVLIVSDTHIPRRARDLPEQVWREVDRADAVIHAGDWCDPASLERLDARAALLVGVHGNNDGADLRARLPEVARATLGGVRFAVVHETGDARGREKRCQERFTDCDVLVFGHSHIPWDTTAPSGLRLLNPGSPTDRRRQPHHTYMTVVAEDGRLGEVRLHRVG